MRYLLGGYYGMRNVGDDVLLYVTLAVARRADPAASFTVISNRSETTPPEAPTTIVPGERRGQTLRQLLRHDVWLFGGGGLLQDGSERSRHVLRRLRDTARIAKMLRKHIVLLGVGVGPLTTREGRDASRSFLEHVDFATVRDEESAALAAAVAPRSRVQVCEDLAFLLPRHQGARTPGSDKVLGVSILPYATSLGGDERSDFVLVDHLAHALGAALRRHEGWTVKLFEFFSGSSEYGDATVLERLREGIGPAARVQYLPYHGDFFSVFQEINRCQAFVGMRFHSCVLSYLAGVPCLMVAYHPKSENLANRLKLHPEAVVPLPLINDVEALASRVEALLDGSPKFVPPVSIDTLTRAAARNGELFGEWLRHQPRRRP